MALFVRFEYGQESRVSRDYGPFPFVQLTSNALRVGPDGDILGSFIAEDDLWYAGKDDTFWSDVIIYEHTHDQVSRLLADLYSTRFQGRVNCEWDSERHAYEISGSGLQPHPDLKELFPNGWNLLDFLPEEKAMEELRKGQQHA